MLRESQGRKNVFVLDGLARDAKGYALTKTLSVPAGGASALEFSAACDPRTDGWKVAVKADGKDLGTTVVNKETMQNGWTQIKILVAGDGEADGGRDRDGARDPARGEEGTGGLEHHRPAAWTSVRERGASCPRIGRRQAGVCSTPTTLKR